MDKLAEPIHRPAKPIHLPPRHSSLALHVVVATRESGHPPPDPDTPSLDQDTCSPEKEGRLDPLPRICSSTVAAGSAPVGRQSAMRSGSERRERGKWHTSAHARSIKRRGVLHLMPPLMMLGDDAVARQPLGHLISGRRGPLLGYDFATIRCLPTELHMPTTKGEEEANRVLLGGERRGAREEGEGCLTRGASWREESCWAVVEGWEECGWVK